jgi:hypothetical protein
MDAVGFALGASILGAAIQWLVDGANESAFDQMTAAWEFPVGGLGALTVVFIVGHYLFARHEVFVAMRARVVELEGLLAQGAPSEAGPGTATAMTTTHIQFLGLSYKREVHRTESQPPVSSTGSNDPDGA